MATNSPLVTKWVGCHSSNFTVGRQGCNIQGIVIHHQAGTNINTMDNIFNTAGRNGSAHYGVSGAEIHQYVDEANIAWHCGNWWGNCRTIGIETTNSTGAPDWRVSDQTFDNLCRLVADIAKRNGLGRLYYNPNEDCPKLCGHKDWIGSATSCFPVHDTEVLTDKGFVPLSWVNKETKIAQWDSETTEITFANPLGIVEPYEAEVIRVRDTEATENHQMFTKEIETKRNENRGKWTGKYIKKEFGSSDKFTFPTEAKYNGKGLDLTNDELEYLVWVQADGHYMKDGDCHYGVEFHLKKQRKIDRIVALLEDMGKEYAFTKQSNGTTKIRIYGVDEVNWCEKYLADKEFTMDWIEMSDAQYERFREVIVLADGCSANSSYSSKSYDNVDIVQIILQLHGQTSRIYYGNEHNPRVFFGAHTYCLDKRSGVSRRKAIVSCVEMPKGSMVIRQYGKIQIVGNCPGPYLYPKLQELCDRANAINYPPAAPSISWKDIPTTTYTVAFDSALLDLSNMKVVKELSAGEEFIAVQKCSKNGEEFVRTEYSKSKNVNNGVRLTSLALPITPAPEPTPEPEPTPTPEPAPVVPEGIPSSKTQDDGDAQQPSEENKNEGQQPQTGGGTAKENWLVRLIKFIVSIFTRKSK